MPIRLAFLYTLEADHSWSEDARSSGLASTYSIRSLNGDDAPWLKSVLEKQWGSPILVLRDECVDARMASGFVAGDRLGFLQYRTLSSAKMEVLTILALEPGKGIGRALMSAVAQLASKSGMGELVVTTTNDNLAALSFYQRCGFHLHALREGAVTRARAKLKPELPWIGLNGIEVRDEIELRMQPTGRRRAT